MKRMHRRRTAIQRIPLCDVQHFGPGTQLPEILLIARNRQFHRGLVGSDLHLTSRIGQVRRIR